MVLDELFLKVCALLNFRLLQVDGKSLQLSSEKLANASRVPGSQAGRCPRC